jgi:hypothetical protein
MDTLIHSKFQRMGARVKVNAAASRGRRPASRLDGAPVRVDIRADDDGEFFDLRFRDDVSVEVVDVRPADRHLLLLARVPGEDAKSKFLCGHDERHWFVAAVPESAHARNVQDAKDALKPAEVWREMEQAAVRSDRRDRRRTAAFVRQGEWFFLPRPWLRPDDRVVLRNEAIRRGGGKPHVCQFLYRTGGELVYVSRENPNGLTAAQYAGLPADVRDRQTWRQMARNATAYVKGSVRHPDHKTVWLGHWHQVVMNSETSARAMRHVSFLD